MTLRIAEIFQLEQFRNFFGNEEMIPTIADIFFFVKWLICKKNWYMISTIAEIFCLSNFTLLSKIGK